MRSNSSSINTFSLSIKSNQFTASTVSLAYLKFSNSTLGKARCFLTDKGKNIPPVTFTCHRMPLSQDLGLTVLRTH